MKDNRQYSPLVTVLVPCYNSEKYIKESLDSIMRQTYTNMEILVIDDCSTDNTEKIIDDFARKDSRIIFYKNEENKKLIYSLNKGIDLARGKYFFRIDSDDICHPKRIELQVRAMEDDSSIVACGGGILHFKDDKPEFLIPQRYPTNYEDISLEVAFCSVFAQPCTGVRTSILHDNNIRYSYSFPLGEDYYLWQILLKHGKGINLPFFLLKYRNTSNGLTASFIHNEMLRFEIISNIQKISLDRLNVKLNAKELKFHYLFSLTLLLQKLNIKEYPISFVNKYFSDFALQVKKNNSLSSFVVNKILGKFYLKYFIYNFKKMNWVDILFRSDKIRILYGIINLVQIFIKYEKIKPYDFIFKK